MVCLGAYGTHWVPSLALDELCVMLWDMARFQNYDIRSPYNREAAQWAANQPTFRFPIDARPLRDGRAALGRVESPPAEARDRPPAKIPEPGESICILDMEINLHASPPRRRRPEPAGRGRSSSTEPPADRARARSAASTEEPMDEPELTFLDDDDGRPLDGPDDARARGRRPTTAPLIIDDVRPLWPAPPDPLVAAGAAGRGPGPGRRRRGPGQRGPQEPGPAGRRDGDRDRPRRRRAVEPVAVGPVPPGGRRPVQGRGRRPAGRRDQPRGHASTRSGAT